MQEAQKGNQVFEGNDRQTQETNDEFENRKHNAQKQR